MNKIAAVLAVGALALTACGGSDDDDGGGGGGGDSARAEILSTLTADGTEGIDEQCLEDKVDALSDSDAEFIAENLDYEGDEAPPGASEGALTFATSLVDCIDLSGLGE